MSACFPHELFFAAKVVSLKFNLVLVGIISPQVALMEIVPRRSIEY